MSRDWHKDMRMCEKASEGPWHFTDTEDVWMLFGGFNGHMQLIKAPKNSSAYAEYWPESDDAVFISETRTALPYWLQQFATEKERADKAEAEAEKWRIEAFQKYPTPDAYEAVCAALLKHRSRADQAEAELLQLRASIAWIKTMFESDWTYEPGIGEVVDEIINVLEHGTGVLEDEKTEKS
ncbi:hypothetical protein ACFSVM_25750 [Paenibacillus shunpengii]|uniref:Uncharacterized protein n=1 Tax=Paenibacillus shunpengii TaxID=2054424 RepID=A0ABW5SVN2_9BACL